VGRGKEKGKTIPYMVSLIFVTKGHSLVGTMWNKGKKGKKKKKKREETKGGEQGRSILLLPECMKQGGGGGEKKVGGPRLVNQRETWI